jgi:hypothetical protein
MSTAQRSEEESARHTRRLALKALNVSKPANGRVCLLSLLPPAHSTSGLVRGSGTNLSSSTGSSKPLDSSLKRHTAFLTKIRQSVGAENRDQLLKDIETLSLEKYVEELGGAVLEGISRCKTEKDVWSAVEVRLYPSSRDLRSSSRRDGGCWSVDNQRDSSSVPDVFYTESCSFVFYGTGCTFSCFYC